MAAKKRAPKPPVPSKPQARMPRALDSKKAEADGRTRWERLFDAVQPVRRTLEEEEIGHGFDVDAEPPIWRRVLDALVDAAGVRWGEERYRRPDASSFQVNPVFCLDTSDPLVKNGDEMWVSCIGICAKLHGSLAFGSVGPVGL